MRTAPSSAPASRSGMLTCSPISSLTAIRHIALSTRPATRKITTNSNQGWVGGKWNSPVKSRDTRGVATTAIGAAAR